MKLKKRLFRFKGKKRLYFFISWSLIAAGIIGLIVAGLIYHNQPRPPENVGIQEIKVKSVDVNPAPSSVKPTATTIASYSVPATHPKYITIPAIGISNVPVLELGLTSGGAIATPDNIYDSGWYDGSSLPGQPGAMFIYGHVSSWTADGVFYNLKKLTYGDAVIITTGNNQTYTYIVKSTQVYPYNNVNMNQVLAPVDPNAPGLNLMTCTGQVIPGTSEFNERLAVFASLSSS